MKTTTARGPAALGAAVLAAILLAACGGGSGSSSTSTTSSTASGTNAAATAPANGATGGTVARRTALVACLKKYGVTLPSGGAGFGGRFGATGATGRRFGFGATGATGRRFPFGGTGARGRAGGFPAGGAPGTGGVPGAGGFAGNSKFAQALQKCGGFGAGGFGGGRFGATGRSGAFSFSSRIKTELTNFVACMKKHGETLPTPNVSGTGSIFGKVNQNSATFKAAYAQCKGIIASFLNRPSGGPAGGAGPPAA
jgi:hypothetical protein